MRPNKSLRRQRGVTMLVALIMLLLTTLLVVSSFNMGTSSVQAVSNMQTRGESLNAAHETIEEVISRKGFMDAPNAVFGAGCNGNPNAKCIDVNSDGVADVRVSLAPSPACQQVRPLQNQELNLNDRNESGCASQNPQEAFGQGGATSASECSATVWQIRANAEDTVTATRTSVTQGVAVVIPKNQAETACP